MMVNSKLISRISGAAALALGALLLVAPTHVGVDTDSVQSISNKTLDRTNTLQRWADFQLWAALCANDVPSSFWDLPNSSAASAMCATGSNTLRGVLDFSSTATNSAQYTLQTPVGYTTSANTEAEILWYTASTSGSVVWQLATACAANDATATDDPSFNTANSVVSAAPGTANRIQSAAISSLTMTGCADGYALHLKLTRDPSNGSDTVATNPARLMMVRLRMPKE
jgi:hypothetical protein